MQEIILQVYPRGVNPIVQVSQYDKGRNLLLKLYEGSTAYNIPEGCDVLFEGQKPDGTVFSYQAAYTDNLVTLSLEQQVTLVAGRVTCELRIINGDSVNIGTINFTMYVEASPVDSDDDISETEIPALIDLGQQYAERAETAAEYAESYAEACETAAETAQEILDSIPDDYTNISTDVDILKLEMQDASEILLGRIYPDWEYGSISASDGSEWGSSSVKYIRTASEYVSINQSFNVKLLNNEWTYAVHYYNENDGWVSSTSEYTSDNSFTLPSGASYARIAARKTNASNIDNIDASNEILIIFPDESISDKVENLETAVTENAEYAKDYTNLKTRKWAGKFWHSIQSAYSYNDNIDGIKSKIDDWIETGVDGFILTCNMYWDSDNSVMITRESDSLISSIISYVQEKGKSLYALKVHNYDYGTYGSSTDWQEAYNDECVRLATLVRTFPVYNVIIFNECQLLYDSSYTSWIVETINNVKACNVSVSISLDILMSGFGRISNNIISILNFLSFNYYPPISNKGKKTLYSDFVDAWEYSNILGYLEIYKYYYPSKEIIISEVGVNDYWPCIGNPSKWDLDVSGETATDGLVPGLYLKACMEVLNNNVYGIASWYGILDDKCAAILKEYLGGDQ